MELIFYFHVAQSKADEVPVSSVDKDATLVLIVKLAGLRLLMKQLEVSSTLINIIVGAEKSSQPMGCFKTDLTKGETTT